MNNQSELEFVQFVKTTLKRSGMGIEGDPIRVIIQYWTMSGQLLFEIDTYTGQVNYYP